MLDGSHRTIVVQFGLLDSHNGTHRVSLMHRRRTAIISLFLVFVLAISPAATLLAPSSNENSNSPVTINVLAASSLSNSFNEAAEAFSQDNPNIKVTLSFAGSSTLVTQIEAGSPIDVVALADQVNMLKLSSKELVSTSSIQTLTNNRLTIITTAGNPLNIKRISDLGNPKISVALCDTSQPCGRYADEILTRARISLTPASRESSVTGVVSRVATGEADAGIAYVSDATSNSNIASVPIPDSDNVVADYPIALASTPSSGSSTAAQAFLDFMMSPAGQDILKNFGFTRIK